MINLPVGFGNPWTEAFAITPADSDLAHFSRGLFVGGTGTLVITTVSGDVVTFTGVPVGWFPVNVVRVAAASTATNIVGGY